MKDRIKKDKLGFFLLCLGFLTGLIWMAGITDLFIERAEAEATVTKTWLRHTGTYSPDDGDTDSFFARHDKRRWRMNIEWVDRNGEIQGEGDLYNREQLTQGDSFTIFVDAKTESRRMLSKPAAVVMFLLGAGVCILCARMMHLCYFCGDADAEKKKERQVL